jgi:hypothetical protein
MKSKLNIGIEIDEILRAKWLQFDRYYAEEFGTEGIPENPYVYDFFKGYKWEDRIESNKELKEPEDMPDNVNPLDYKVNSETNEALVDFLLFKKEDKIKLTAKEVYNRFMYEDFLFEIHGNAPLMYRGIDLHLTNFYRKYKDTVNFTIISCENQLTIPPTLFFLSRTMSRFKNYKFIENESEIWDGNDILITTNPNIINNIPKNKKIIKLIRPYNKDLKSKSLDVLHIADLIDNAEFEKMINFKKLHNK